MTSTSTRCRWSRSPPPSRTSSASPSPTTSSATSRPSVTRSASSRRTRADPPGPAALAGPVRTLALPRPTPAARSGGEPMSTSASDVVVPGPGATTPLGGDVASTWDALLAGRSGVSRITDDWIKEYPAQLVARLAADPTEQIDRVRARRLDRSQQVAVIAAEEAWREAGAADAGVDPVRIAVVFGTGIGGALTLLDQDDVLEAKGPKRVSPFPIPMLMPSGRAAAVGLALGAKGGVPAPVSACASGAEAIRWGLDLIRFDRADIVLVGGTEACVHPLPMAGFAAMRAMSTRNDEPERASRPFDKARDGFVPGEGAACIVLERADAAKARGARIHARLAGAAGTADGYDLVAPHPEGEGAARAITAAL